MASFTPEKRYFAPSFSRLLQEGRCEAAVAYASSVVFTAEDLKDAVKRMMRLIPTNQTQLQVLQAALGIMTVLAVSPLSLSLLHQAGAAILWMTTLVAARAAWR